jgi:hypothetical protein
MAAIQLSSGFYSDNGGTYDIEIWNESFVGSNTTVTTNDLKITYESEGDQIMESLKASRCSFTLVNDSAAVDTFIDNLVAGNEDQFKIVIKKQSVLEWCGVILVDQVSWEDKPKPRLLTITAIDGIGRLADIEFDFATDGANPAQNTMLDYIFEALEYNDLSQYWNGTQAYFKESCEFYDTQIAVTGTSVSPFLKTRFDRALLVTDDVIGERKITGGSGIGKGTSITLPDYRPLTCAEVIDSILQIMSCRMFMTGGSYYIQQIRNFSTSSYNQRSISKTLGVLSYQTVSPRQTEGTEIQRLGDCRWSYLTPLQEVRLDSIPRVTAAQSGGGIIELSTATTPLSHTVQLGTLRGGSGSGKSFRIILSMEAFAPASSLPSYVSVAVNFTAGSYRLYSTPQKPDKVTWSTTATDRYTRLVSYLDLQKPGLAYIDIMTPEFPSTSETSCTLTVEYTANGTWSSANYIKIQPIQIFELIDDAIIQESQFKVENPRTQNSKTIDYGTPLLTDMTQAFSTKNTFEVNSTGSTWVFSDLWSAGYSANVELVKTLCLETMSLQDRPVGILQGTLKYPTALVSGTPEMPRFSEVYYYDSDTYVFNGGTLNCRTDEFNGEWFQFVQNKTGLSVTAEDGDGYVYRGNDKFGTPKKNTQDKDKWNRDWILEGEIAAVDTDTTSGAITSITVTSTNKAIKDGDLMNIRHPVNLRIVAVLTADGDHAAAVTTINVVSTTPSELLLAGYIVITDKDQVLENGKTKAGMLYTTTGSAPATGGFGDGGNAILNPGDGFLYYSDGSQTWKITGTLVS